MCTLGQRKRSDAKLLEYAPCFWTRTSIGMNYHPVLLLPDTRKDSVRMKSVQQHA